MALECFESIDVRIRGYSTSCKRTRRSWKSSTQTERHFLKETGVVHEIFLRTLLMALYCLRDSGVVNLLYFMPCKDTKQAQCLIYDKETHRNKKYQNN